VMSLYSSCLVVSGRSITALSGRIQAALNVKKR
jgi:hypothetical protein